MIYYTGEVIYNENGVECQVLDIARLDFSKSCVGRKKTETLVLKANGNEKIETINSKGLVESLYITSLGDAIFVNNEKDMYVPRDELGNAWQFDDIENHGYEKVSDVFSYGGNDAIKVKSKIVADLLVECINKPTIIKDAFGDGVHQFLSEGATLKRDRESGRVTGIDKIAFDMTWEIDGDKKY